MPIIMPYFYQSPRSVIAQKQEELLESFINLKQYDKFLFYLESTLFSSPPCLYCPSPLVINIIFSLASLGEYCNNDLIRKEFHKVSSSQPIHIRAVNLLKRLVNIIQDPYESTQSSDSERTEYNREEVTYAKHQLIKSLELITKDKGRLLRPRLYYKQYVEKPSTDTEFAGENGPGKSSQEKLMDSTECSPQKKLLQQLFDDINRETNVSGSDDDSDSDNSNLDKKSYMILKNERFDIALQNERFWNAVIWALQCSSSGEKIEIEAWKVWKRILDIIFDILDIELEDFIHTKAHHLDNEKTGMPPMFSKTVTYKALEKVGRHYPISKMVDIIFVGSNGPQNKKVGPIFTNELSLAKSVHLADTINISTPDAEYTLESIVFRKKLFYLVAKAIMHSGLECDPEQTRWSLEDLSRCTTLKLLDASYVDFVRYFVLDESEITEGWKLELLLDILLDFFVQVNTYKFNTPGEQWIYDKDFTFISDLLANVTYMKKDYDHLGEKLTSKMASDYSKLNFTLFLFLNLWLKSSELLDLNSELLSSIIEWCEVGEEKRKKVLQNATAKIDDVDIDELFSLSKTVKIQFNKKKY